MKKLTLNERHEDSSNQSAGKGDYVPQEVIIVEGRDDTQRLIETFGPTIRTIETNGSALSRATLRRIEAAAAKYGVIVLTDPDYQGVRLRRIITERVPQAKQAHLSPADTQSKREGKSLGIEHATPAAIIAALQQVSTPQVGEADAKIPLAELVELKLIGHPSAKERRQRVAVHYRLGHLNGKQLQKQLALYQIDLTSLKQFLEEEVQITDDN